MTTTYTRRVKAGGAELAAAVTEPGGPAEPPTVVLVHGYPDTRLVWDDVVERLSGRLRVVTYDVRGAGESSRPRRTGAYAMRNLNDDLRAIIDAVSPDRSIHLVGHDWGSVQSWGAITGGRLDGRIASFTSISGPCIEHFGQWVRDRLRHPTPRHLRELFGQFSRSWYLAFGAIPGVPQLAWRFGGTRVFPRMIERTEGVSRRESPTFLQDALDGMKLYRANSWRFLRPGSSCRTDVPVQMIAPTKDLFVSPEQSKDVVRYADRVWRRELAAGHWGALYGQPETLAAWIEEFIDHIDGAPQRPALERAVLQRGRALTGTTA